MGSFPESEPGVGGGANDTSVELGGSLGIALHGTAYRDELTDLVGGHLPTAALETAKDSVGGGAWPWPRRSRRTRRVGRSRRWSMSCGKPSPTASPRPA
ncbi:hypothetical protein RKD20_009050 [Streptomyces sp. SLBN-8D4]